MHLLGVAHTLRIFFPHNCTEEIAAIFAAIERKQSDCGVYVASHARSDFLFFRAAVKLCSRSGFLVFDFQMSVGQSSSLIYSLVSSLLQRAGLFVQSTLCRPLVTLGRRFPSTLISLDALFRNAAYQQERDEKHMRTRHSVPLCSFLCGLQPNLVAFSILLCSSQPYFFPLRFFLLALF